MSKIDDVARAIYERRNGRGCKPWNIQTKAHKAPYLDDARAAIEAMRKPNVEMLESCGNGECAKWAPGAWLNMIDAALNPSQT